MRTKYRRTIDHNLELTRRISSEEKLINPKLESLTDESIEELAEKINSRSVFWEEEKCIDSANMPYCALAAAQNGLINPVQFGTLMLYWSTSTTQPKDFIKSHRLFTPEDKIDLSSFQLLQKTHLPAPDLNLTEEEYKEFFERMKELPISERQFFEISYQDQNTILNVLENQQMFNVFGQIDPPNGTRRIIPSVGMMQVYLDVKFKDNAVKINLVIGLSSLEDIIKNGLNSERDVVIPFPDISLPLADGFSAKGPRFTIHDFYHSTMASCAPPKEREFIISTSDAIKNYLDERRQLFSIELNPYPPKMVEIIYQYWDSEETAIHFCIDELIDMDLHMYRPDNLLLAMEGADLEVMYWTTVLKMISISRLITPLSDKTLEGIFAKLFELAIKNKRIRELNSNFNYLKSFFKDTLESGGRLQVLYNQRALYYLNHIIKIWRKTQIQSIPSSTELFPKTMVADRLPHYVIVSGSKTKMKGSEMYQSNLLLVGDKAEIQKFKQCISDVKQTKILSYDTTIATIENNRYTIWNGIEKSHPCIKKFIKEASLILCFGKTGGVWLKSLDKNYDIGNGYIPTYEKSGEVSLKFNCYQKGSKIPAAKIPVAQKTERNWERYTFNLLSAATENVPTPLYQNGILATLS